MNAHGTRGRYVEERCRCVACTSANSAYQLKRGRQRRAYVEVNGLPSSVQHGVSAYRNWGCRCDQCRTAHAAKCAEYYARTRA